MALRPRRWLVPARSPASAPASAATRSRTGACCRRRPTGPRGVRNAWIPGEAGARARLSLFAGHEDSSTMRGAAIGPIRTAPRCCRRYLSLGEISPRQVWHTVAAAAAAESGARVQCRGPLRELGWREFAHHLLYHWQDLPTRNWRGRIRRIPLARGRRLPWRPGSTGAPAIRSSMPACASSGRPAGCTTACA